MHFPPSMCVLATSFVLHFRDSGFRVVSHKLRLPVVQYVVLGVFLSRIYKGNAMTVNQ